ncbi:MAG: hypothetical protein HKN11_07655 [Rhizobiales bacterium]|nr:hypothetical protein [Hyphomicrobiales bacterium]
MFEDDKSASLVRFRKLVADTGDFNISLFVLELIRELRAAPHMPEHEIAAGGADRELGLKAVQWLARERIVAIAGGTVQLTPTGHQSLANAANADQQLSGFLSGDAPHPDGAEANRMVLTILKAHFEQRRGCAP